MLKSHLKTCEKYEVSFNIVHAGKINTETSYTHRTFKTFHLNIFDAIALCSILKTIHIQFRVALSYFESASTHFTCDVSKNKQTTTPLCIYTFNLCYCAKSCMLYSRNRASSPLSVISQHKLNAYRFNSVQCSNRNCVRGSCRGQSQQGR